MINEIFNQTSIDDLKIGSELPYDVVEDLKVFMTQDNDFYRKNIFPRLGEVQSAVSKGGKYNKKMLLPVIEQGILEYLKKFDIKKRPHEFMNDGQKLECISSMLKDEMENFRKGEY
tara:strand:+ start:93 stop:440 length:348 start_codon:yes stop_codon:yes gene_type:complete